MITTTKTASNIPDDIRKCADFLLGVEAVGISPKHRTEINERLGIVARYLEKIAIVFHHQEIHMGRVAQDIGKLEANIAQLTSDKARLQAQLDAANANSLDSDDLAALTSVETQFPDAPPAPAPTPVDPSTIPVNPAPAA